MSDYLPRASQESVRGYSFTHSDISFSLPSSVFLARVAGVCVVTPSCNDPNSRREDLLYFFFFLLLLNLTFFHWSDRLRLLLLVGRVGCMASSSSSLPVPSRPIPSLFPARLYRSLGWERQRERVFLMTSAWKGL